MDAIGGTVYEQIARVSPQVGLISISMNQRTPKPDLPWVANCPNALDLSLYPDEAPPRRLPPLPRAHEPGQGLPPGDRRRRHGGTALEDRREEARAGGEAYFDEYVRPHLSDEIEYLGEVTHGEKVELLQNARATLFPIEWAEPFGLVMIESMACGTPVIATRYRRRARGDRRRPQRHHRRRLPRHGRRARGGRRARARGAATLSRRSVLAGADGRRLRRRRTRSTSSASASLRACSGSNHFCRTRFRGPTRSRSSTAPAAATTST